MPGLKKKKNNAIMESMGLLKILSSLVLVISLSSCSFDGSYRYPCQDPANWGTEDCKPPICEVNGACPEDLVGPDIVNGIIEEQTVEEEVINE